MTKREMYEVIANVFETVDVNTLNVEPEVVEEIVIFTGKEIAAIDRKNVKARERAAEKRAEGDAITAAIEGILTNEPKTVNDILAELEDATLTPAKIVARATRLVKAEKAVKETVKVDGRTLVGYVKA